MPATYAHYRFGQEVLSRLSETTAKPVRKYHELYNIGLHGPDLLFYYNALTKNRVNSVGHRLHKQSGGSFFREAAKVIRRTNNNQAHLAHIYGYLCHFALDVTCHGFVEGQIKNTGVGHLALESELERHFLIEDGKDPLSTRVTGHLIASKANAEVIKDFYPGISAGEVYKSIKDMNFYLNLLVSPGKVKRGLIVNSLKLVGQLDTVGGLLIKAAEDPRAIKSVERLLKLYEKGRDLAVRLIEEYPAYLSGEKELDYIYGYNFNTILVEKG